MKFNYTPLPSQLVEEGQPNPIRWCLVSKDEEGNYKNITTWMRCKDYFNDVCVAYNGGPRFRIYGFSTENLTLPEKGQPILIAVTNLTQEFHNNLCVFNEWLGKNGMPLIEETVLASGISVLSFDSVYFSNTHHVSLVTLIVRLLNTSHTFSTFEEVIAYKNFPNQDQYKWDAVGKVGRFFFLPEKYRKYYWYADSNNNSEGHKFQPYSFSSVVHNNGVLSWIASINREEMLNATQVTPA